MTAVRYKKSVEPVYTDGRDIDLQVAELSGEAAHQQSSGSSDKHIAKQAQTWTQLPEPQPNDPTYYDRPLLNEPVWEWSIPTYYYVGGLAGATLVLGAAAQLSRSKKLQRLIKRCHWLGFIGCCISGALLTYDLGRPARFFNMLRVFRPTSPMNLGAWILSGTGGASMVTVLLRERDGLLGTIGESFGYASGVFGMALATYTGVLVANTEIPVWQESRRMLPVLFGASAIASVGSLFELFVEDADERRVTKAFGSAGQIAEVTAGIVMERQASKVPRVGRPLKRGLSGVMWRTAALLTATSLAVGLLSNQTRGKRVAAGVLGTVGSLLMRFAVEHAGVVSSRDARASFHQQRAETFRAKR
jgi:formate-dependent nitrite reductase membrane component NrfD